VTLSQIDRARSFHPRNKIDKESCRDSGTRKPQRDVNASCRLSRHDSFTRLFRGWESRPPSELRALHPRLPSYCRCRGMMQRMGTIAETSKFQVGWHAVCRNQLRV
jgi:hypothetical protein